MLKKITPFLFAVLTALTLTLAPVQSAAAWKEVCMHNPLWKSGFSAKFYVVHSFDTRNDLLPAYANPPQGWRQKLELPDSLGEKDANDHGSSYRMSPTFPVRSSRCVSLKGISHNSPLLIYVHPAAGEARLCATHPSNPKKWYLQNTASRYNTLWYLTGGAAWNPWCHFTHETNPR